MRSTLTLTRTPSAQVVPPPAASPNMQADAKRGGRKAQSSGGHTMDTQWCCRALHHQADLLAFIRGVQIHPSCGRKKSIVWAPVQLWLSVRAPAPPAAFRSSHYNQSAGSDWLAASEVTRPEQRQSPGREGARAKRQRGIGGVLFFFFVASGKVSPCGKHN